MRKFELASSVLTSAAKVRLVIGIWSISCCPFCTLWLFQFEQSLRNADDPQNLHQQSIAQTTVVYYCSRMEAVSLMSRQTYLVQLCTGAESCARLGRRATTVSPNICFGTLPVSFLRSSAKNGPHAHLIVPENNVERLAHLSARDVCTFPISPHVRYLRSRPSHQRELLASKVLEIGRSLLTGGALDGERKVDTRPEEAVMWLQKAFSLAEHLDDTLTAGAAELKVRTRYYRALWLMVVVYGFSNAY